MTEELPEQPQDTTDGSDGDWKRRAIVDAAIDAARGGGRRALTEHTVSVIAGVHEDDVHRNFPTMDSLIAATVTRWHERRVTALVPIANQQGTLAFLRALLDANQDEPQLIWLLVGTLVDGSDPDHPGHTFYQRQYATFHRALRTFIAADLERGRIPAGVRERQAADSCLTIYEGVQLQAMLRPTLEPLPAFDSAITALQGTWAQQQPPQQQLDAAAPARAHVVASSERPPQRIASDMTVLRIALPRVRIRSLGSGAPAADVRATAGDTILLPATGTYSITGD